MNLHLKEYHPVSRISIYMLAAVLIAIGVFHLMRPYDTLVYVPSFLPGGITWAYLVGACFILVGISCATNQNVKITSYMSLREMRRAIYKLGNEAFRDRVMLAWAASGNDKAQAWRALVAHAMMWTPPKLPLTGDEIMAAGVPSGPKVGIIMREVEDWWIDADFPDDKLSVIERLKAVAQGLS